MIYPNSERFEIGGSKTLHESDDDAATVVAAGVTRVRGAQGVPDAAGGGHRRTRDRRLLGAAD